MPFANHARWKLMETIYPPITRGQERLLLPIAEGKKRIAWICGRQVGKTELLARFAVDQLLEGKQLLWIAPTHDLAQIGYERTEQRLQQFLRLLPAQYRKYARFRRASPRGIRWLYTNGSCKWLTAKNYRQLQGYTLDWIVIDESASIDDLQHILDSYLIPTTAVKMGGIILASTPRGLTDFALLAQTDEYTTIHITTQEGGLVNEMFINEQRELYKLRGAEHLFEQEFLGKILDNAGKFFTRMPNITDAPPDWIAPPDCIIGIDWGYTSPFACVRVLTDGNNYYVDGIIYETRTTPEQQATLLRDFAKQYRNTRLVIDPSTPDSALKTYKLHGIVPKPANNDRVGGWQLIRDLLQHNRLHVHPACTHLIEEWESAEYNIKRTDDLIATSDHALDALRYAIAECYRPYREPQPITYHTLLQQSPRKYTRSRFARL